jgi:hypothetical protein
MIDWKSGFLRLDSQVSARFRRLRIEAILFKLKFAPYDFAL